jgi:hypothetical protein
MTGRRCRFDPLIALTGVISDRLKGVYPKGAIIKAKTAAAKLARPVGRIALAAATGGVSEFAGPVFSALVNATGAELQKAAESFWKQEDGKREAMRQLRESLIALTSAQGGDEKPRPIVVVVDELDRCRPDYALSLIETIKHFFSVPNIHFVLGVNLSALQYSVSARYGGGFDSEGYLRRFISITMALPDVMSDHDQKEIALHYFRKTAFDMRLSPRVIEDQKS